MSASPDSAGDETSQQRWKFLPKIGSVGYYVMLGVVAIFVLGPLGGVTASYMNFSLGFFIGGQVLAGILGSVVTLGYGPAGKHGANYMQTMAASVASMAAMGVLIQAMVWLGMPAPPAWQLILYFLCIGMFGIGIGMLYTPILVDKMKLNYPSGLAVANILRALTDPKILRQSVSKLGGGIGGGIGISIIVDKLSAMSDPGRIMAAILQFSSATFGGGMIVGARISTSAILVGAIGLFLTPWLRANGYIGEHDPFRKIGFIFALGTILGAAIVDMSLLAKDAVGRVKAARDDKAAATGAPANIPRLIAWVVFWAIALLIVATQVLNVPAQWVLFAIVMAFIFQMINGISQGITDQNPISSAFVVTVLLMAFLGLRDPLIGLFGGSILLVSCTVGVDMQQDRSTGWRLGSNRAIQFRFQMVGIIMGAILAVLMTRVFLEAYPILQKNLFLHPELRETEGHAWQSAMTYKFVGILLALGEDKSKLLHALSLGLGVGFVLEVIRKVLFRSEKYKAWKVSSRGAAITDFTLDAVLLASPYASSFGGFVEFETALWFGLGGIGASMWNWFGAKRKAAARASGSPGEGEALPEDMSSTSLVGGGLIAGESLFALYVGLAGLIASGALAKILGGELSVAALAPKIVTQFLSPRERVVVATIARSGGFSAGRQATGYEKKDLLESITAERLVKRCLQALGDPVLYDAWLLRYPVGSEIPAHVDPPIEGMCHVRINALALTCEGGVLYVDGAEIPLDTGDAYVFRPDVMKHMVTKVARNERLMLSVGANVDEAHARRLGLA